MLKINPLTKGKHAQPNAENKTAHKEQPRSVQCWKLTRSQKANTLSPMLKINPLTKGKHAQSNAEN